MKKRPKRRLEFWIARDQYESLLARHEVFGVPIAEQLRRAVDEFLEKHGKVSPRRKRNETVEE
jgi:hypothetical protein